MEKKVVEKKKVEKKTDEDIIIMKDANRLINFISYMSSFFASILAIIIFVFGIITTLTVANNTSDDVIHNNFVVTFISKISNSSIEDTKLNILTMNSKISYIVFDIVLPTIALVCAALLIIWLSCLLLKFFNNSLTDKKMFTIEKLNQLGNIIDIFSVILFITWALFNQPSVPFILLIYLLLFITYYLFKKCVNYNLKK